MNLKTPAVIWLLSLSIAHGRYLAFVVYLRVRRRRSYTLHGLKRTCVDLYDYISRDEDIKIISNHFGSVVRNNSLILDVHT